jgi:hypothetical protein
MSKLLRSIFLFLQQRVISFLLFIILVSFVFPASKTVRVYMIADATMCLYDKSRYPLTGWGMPFANYFDSTVIIENKARGGRSSKSFIQENLWKAIVEKL